MRGLMWLPPEVREAIAALDPAPVPPVGERPDWREIVQRADALDEADDAPADIITLRPARELGNGRRGRRSAIVAAAAAAVVLTAGGAVVLAHRHPSSTSTVVNDQSVAASAGRWANFPVDRRPRPVVLTGDPVAVGGFATSDQKIAFMTGRIVSTITPPPTPPTAPGLALLTGAQALAELRANHARVEGLETPPPPLRVRSIRLTSHQYRTDRGTRPLPAWQVIFEHVPRPVYVLALALRDRFPAAPGYNLAASTARLDASGRRLTIPYVAHHDSTGPCDPGFVNTLHVSQSRTVVVLRITTQELPTASASSGPEIACGLQGSFGWQGDSHPPEITIALAAPLGNRVVISDRGRPYEVSR